MKASYRRWVTAVIVSCLLFTGTREAKADSLQNQVILAFVGVAVAAAAITVGIVYAVRHNPSLKGCVEDGPGGLQIRNEGDSRTWTLLGDTAQVKPGERVRVSGKKKKVGSGESPELIVEKLNKDYGARHARP
jgi:hypothetical protein